MTEQSLTFACGIDALRPRPLATLPHVDSPSDSKRARHARTETTVTPRSATIRVFARPSAAASSARARTTSRRGAVCDRAIRSTVSRWPWDIDGATAARLIPEDDPDTA